MTALTKDIKKFLRDLYGFNNIKETYSIFAVNNADKAYDLLFKEYQKENKKEIKEKANKKAKEFIKNEIQKAEAKQSQKKKVKSIINISSDKFISQIEKWNKKNNKSDKKFELSLKSGIADISRSFKFNNMSHFLNWLEKVKNEKMDIKDYGGSINYIDTEDLFSNIIVENIKIISGGCNKHKAGDKKIKSSFYHFKLYNPTSKDNNCLFCCLSHILGYDVNTKELRKQFNLPTGTEVSINDAYKVIKHFESDIEIIEPDCNEELDDSKQYLLYQNSHYYVVKEFEEVNRMTNKTKRGLLAFDFETRPTDEFHLIKASNTKSYILKDALCCLYYKEYKTDIFKEVALVSNTEKSSARQFIDWLNKEAEYNRSYNIIAHNGGKFDFYFFISNLTDKELLESDIQMRGTTIIGINYRGNLFKDSCCFLTDSLSNLSKSFKVEHGKICNMMLHGKEISSTQLCFYRPELSFYDFINLRTNDPDFWKLYVRYCLFDCIALYEIWGKFTACVNSLIEKINPYLLKKCPLMSSSTIGSHSKKIIVECNKYKGEINYYKQLINNFIEYDNKTADVNMEKYNFLCNFKRGGISHCNKPGKHLSGITGVDIASQYPASLLYSYIPCGESKWITTYDESKYGFYLIKNVKFNSYQLKPVADSTGTSLNWAKNEINELYVDSYMIKYLKENYGLDSFDVEKGLVSNSHIASSKLFGKYINTFYTEKKQQDKYKEDKDDKYNEALRSTIKLYLNSLTGKLVENPAIHFKLNFTEPMVQRLTKYHNIENADDEIKQQYLNDINKFCPDNKQLNGQLVSKEFNYGKINDWIVAGIMVYSYSKRLLFEYIQCLPNDSDDVIHIETDGIYFSTRHLYEFSENLKNYSGDYPCKFGEDLGNLKIEKTTQEGQVAYFLGKKFYNITMNDDYLTKERDSKDKSIYRVKGIPQATIDKEGNGIYLVNTKLYEDIYNGKQVTKSFSTLRKALFTEKTSISTHVLSRTIKPNCEYKLYQ
jgi:hypothetical protein